MARRRWRVLWATAGALLAAAPLVAATPAEPVEPSVAATPAESVELSVAAASAEPVAWPVAAPSVSEGAVTTPVPAAASVSARTGPAPTAGDRVPARDADPAPSTVAAGPSILSRSEPTRVHIPAIGVDSELVGLGLQDDGSMQVPPGAFPAGWYTGAPTPGELGPAILAGHVDYGGSAGVFHRLGELEPGDGVEVARRDGSTAVFRVTRVEQHRKDAFPTAAVYGDIDHAGLRLITCGGPFDHGVHSYVDNVVVFAELDPAGVGADRPSS